MPEFTIDVSELSASQRLAQQVAECCLEAPRASAQVIVLTGTLGAGKTQWTRFFCQALRVPEEMVTSPTYVLLHRYTGQRVIYHFDFYRLASSAEVWDLGIDELFEQPVVILIEWGDKFAECLPDDYLAIHLELQSDGRRSAHVTSHSNSLHRMDGSELLQRLVINLGVKDFPESSVVDFAKNPEPAKRLRSD